MGSTATSSIHFVPWAGGNILSEKDIEDLVCGARSLLVHLGGSRHARRSYKLNAADLAVFNEAKRTGFILGRKQDRNLFYLFYLWAEATNVPFVSVVNHRKFADVTMDQITIHHMRDRYLRWEALRPKFPVGVLPYSWGAYTRIEHVPMEVAPAVARWLLDLWKGTA